MTTGLTTMLANVVTIVSVAALNVKHSRGKMAASFCSTGGEWVQEWSDEFDGEALDKTSWDVISSAQRGPVTVPVGDLSVTACREAECRAENVHVSSGLLHLVSDRDTGNSSKYHTGGITTRGHRAWADAPGPYRMCISAKLPKGAGGAGVWPAHWMLPDNGYSDRCLDEGEMDIMEMINEDGGSYSTYHWMSSWPRVKCADFRTYHQSAHALTHMPSTWGTEFHEYAVERSAEHIAFAVDGRVVLNIAANPDIGLVLSHTPHFLILNTAVGGAWPGHPSVETTFPVEHTIDYVRVSRKKQSAVPAGRLSSSMLQEDSSPQVEFLQPPKAQPVRMPLSATRVGGMKFRDRMLSSSRSLRYA